jgi:hypothetical protein
VLKRIIGLLACALALAASAAPAQAAITQRVRAQLPASQGTVPAVTAQICNRDHNCWNDAGLGYLQAVDPSESSYTAVDEEKWDKHAVYAWQLDGTNQCVTWTGTSSPQNEFVLAYCNGRPYQEFLYIDELLYNEGASPGNTATVQTCAETPTSGTTVTTLPPAAAAKIPNECHWTT